MQPTLRYGTRILTEFLQGQRQTTTINRVVQYRARFYSTDLKDQASDKTARKSSQWLKDNGDTLSALVSLLFIGAVGFGTVFVTLASASAVGTQSLSGKLDELSKIINANQAQNNRHYDAINSRFDAMQTEKNRRYDTMNSRFDTIQETLARLKEKK